jgi:predicted nucleotidyltransferase
MKERRLMTPESTDHAVVWQPGALVEMRARLEANPNVLALVLLGSLARDPAAVDITSDVDLLLVVADGAAARFFPTLAWLAPLGTIFGCELYAADHANTVRVCFSDFRRFDFVIATRESVLNIASWPRAPGWDARQVVFVHDDTVRDALLVEVPPPEITLLEDAAFEELVQRFWFKSVVAVNKLLREDALVAVHLTHDLGQDCLVLALHLRDRDMAQGHSPHCWDIVTRDLEAAQRPHNTLGLLDSLAGLAIIFDRLASCWSDAYVGRRGAYLAWLELVRQVVESRT